MTSRSLIGIGSELQRSRGMRASAASDLKHLESEQRYQQRLLRIAKEKFSGDIMDIDGANLADEEVCHAIRTFLTLSLTEQRIRTARLRISLLDTHIAVLEDTGGDDGDIPVFSEDERLVSANSRVELQQKKLNEFEEKVVTEREKRAVMPPSTTYREVAEALVEHANENEPLPAALSYALGDPNSSFYQNMGCFFGRIFVLDSLEQKDAKKAGKDRSQTEHLNYLVKSIDKYEDQHNCTCEIAHNMPYKKAGVDPKLFVELTAECLAGENPEMSKGILLKAVEKAVFPPIREVLFRRLALSDKDSLFQEQCRKIQHVTPKSLGIPPSISMDRLSSASSILRTLFLGQTPSATLDTLTDAHRYIEDSVTNETNDLLPLAVRYTILQARPWRFVSTVNWASTFAYRPVSETALNALIAFRKGIDNVLGLNIEEIVSDGFSAKRRFLVLERHRFRRWAEKDPRVRVVIERVRIRGYKAVIIPEWVWSPLACWALPITSGNQDDSILCSALEITDQATPAQREMLMSMFFKPTVPYLKAIETAQGILLIADMDLLSSSNVSVPLIPSGVLIASTEPENLRESKPIKIVEVPRGDVQSYMPLIEAQLQLKWLAVGLEWDDFVCTDDLNETIREKFRKMHGITEEIQPDFEAAVRSVVIQSQRLLFALDCLPAFVSMNGQYGSATQLSVKLFQQLWNKKEFYFREGIIEKGDLEQEIRRDVSGERSGVPSPVPPPLDPVDVELTVSTPSTTIPRPIPVPITEPTKSAEKVPEFETIDIPQTLPEDGILSPSVRKCLIHVIKSLSMVLESLGFVCGGDPIENPDLLLSSISFFQQHSQLTPDSRLGLKTRSKLRELDIVTTQPESEPPKKPESEEKILLTRVEAAWRISRAVRRYMLRKRFHSLTEFLAISPETKGLRQRNAALRELYETEKEFLSGLRIVKERFLDPLRHTSTSLRRFVKICRAPDIDTMFGKLDPIIQIHSQFLETLDKRVKQWPSNQFLGEIFLQFLDQMTNPHEKYAQNYAKAQDILSRYRKHDSFATFANDSGISALDLMAILISPVKRIPQYRLLLNSLLQNTGENHVDFAALERAHKFSQDVALYINDKMVAAASVYRVYQLKSKLHPDLSSLETSDSRRCAKEGQVYDVGNKKEGYLVLFNDAILLAHKREKSILKPKFFALLSRVEISDDVDTGNVKNSFSFQSLYEKCVVSCDTVTEKLSWLTEFQNAKTGHHSVRAVISRCQPRPRGYDSGSNLVHDGEDASAVIDIDFSQVHQIRKEFVEEMKNAENAHETILTESTELQREYNIKKKALSVDVKRRMSLENEKRAILNDVAALAWGIRRKKTEYSAEKARKQVLTNQLETLQSQLEAEKDVRERVERDMERARKTLEETVMKKEEIFNQVNDSGMTVTELQREIESSAEELSAAVATRLRLRADIAEAERDTAALHAELKVLSIERDAVQTGVSAHSNMLHRIRQRVQAEKMALRNDYAAAVEAHSQVSAISNSLSANK